MQKSITRNRVRPVTVALVRGAYLNMFECQNYLFDKKKVNMQGFAAYKTIHNQFPFTVHRLLSYADLRIPHQVANRIWGDKQLLVGLEKKVRSFDIVHTADPHYYYSYQLAKLRRHGIIKHLVATSWETIPFNNESVYMKKRIKKYAMRYIDQYVCHTRRAKESLMKEGITYSRISVIPLGVDLRRFKPLKKKKEKYVTLLFVGRLVNEKGIQDFMQVYERLQRNRQLKDKIKLRIVGDGPLKMNLRKHKIEKVDYAQMHAVYQDASILIVPSKTTLTWEEQYGMVMVEAMASGMPIVACRSGAIPEIIGDKDQLVKEGNIEQLYKTILRFCKDKKLRDVKGAINRTRAQRYFDSKSTAIKIQKLYSKVLRTS